MANKTIYGCYNSITKAVTFEGEACDSGDYTGCYVASGEHQGQIAVTVSEANCDDTYYGCLNSSTGKFQVVIPDNCCMGSNCRYCASEQTPYQITIVFSGLSFCVGCNPSLAGDVSEEVSASLPSANFVLTQDVANPCKWSTFIDGDFGHYEYFRNGNCNQPYDRHYDYIGVEVFATKISDILRIRGKFWILGTFPSAQAGWDRDFFRGDIVSNFNSCIINGSSVNNSLVVGGCIPELVGNARAYGGTATIYV